MIKDKKNKISFFILISFVGFSLIYYYFRDENSNYHMNLLGSSLTISFPNDIYVKYYRIRDYENTGVLADGTSYKYNTILDISYFKDAEKVQIDNIFKYNIKPNHAYLYQMSQSNENDPTARFKTLGFCIKKNVVLIQKSREKDEKFIRKCHQVE